MPTALDSETTFFSVVGSQDPFVVPAGEQGPGLDLLDALLKNGERPGRVMLAWTPGASNRCWPGGYDAQKATFEAEVRQRLPGVRVDSVPLRVRPNSTADLVPVLAVALEPFRHGGRLHVNTSSGTPQMLEALNVLRGTGWFPEGNVTLWQIDRPEHRQPGQPHHREATTPFLEEALKLDAAFGALERFDFAGAEDAFADLSANRLELPARQASVKALADVAHALWWLDARDFRKAQDALADLELHVAPLTPLRALLTEGVAHDADALVWLTWGRYDRARAQERTADALIWAVILHELMVVKLLERQGLDPEKKRVRTADLRPGLFEKLVGEVPGLLGNGGKELKVMGFKEWITLLKAPSLLGREADSFDIRTNPELDKVRTARNNVIHQGVTPDLDGVDGVVLNLLQHFPFQSPWAKAWVKNPDETPVSAISLRSLTAQLRTWVG